MRVLISADAKYLGILYTVACIVNLLAGYGADWLASVPLEGDFFVVNVVLGAASAAAQIAMCVRLKTGKQRRY